ncbi:ABC transporter permease subunit [Paenibacillus piri]|uniref:ABC transporter permease subunit n=1 Tax=Paenibacillus piri TaxID=2547395 RepID=UPI0014043055
MNTRKKATFKYHLTSFTFYGTSLVLYSLFFAIPAVLGFLYSFTSWNGISSEIHFVGLQNYKEVFTDRRFYNSIWNTLVITFIQVFFFNFVALLLAVFLEKSKIPQIKRVLRGLYFFPYIISYVIVAVIWNYMLNYREGVINIILEKIGLGFLAVDWLGSPSLVIFTMAGINIWAFIGFYLVIYMAALQTIPSSLYESSYIDGAGAFQAFRHITFPLVAPAFTVNAIISVAWGLNTFEPALILTQGGPGFASETISYYIYWAGFLGSRQGYGTAISFVLFLAILLISFVQVKLLRKREVEY